MICGNYFLMLIIQDNRHNLCSQGGLVFLIEFYHINFPSKRILMPKKYKIHCRTNCYQHYAIFKCNSENMKLIFLLEFRLMNWNSNIAFGIQNSSNNIQNSSNKIKNSLIEIQKFNWSNFTLNLKITFQNF